MGTDTPIKLIPGETRIRDVDGFCGTVVYVGPVASAKNPSEEYAGIVWDDPSRGKHDGSVICRRTNQIVRHFSCTGPTQGSFLRLNKMDCGVPLNASLLRSKYVEMQAPVVAPNNILPHTAMTSGGHEKPIEFLGEMKIRKWQQLEDIDKVSLRREGISQACPDNGELVEYQHIRDIDLAGNLLSNWNTIFEILDQFPQLERLNLASNRIRNIIQPPSTISTFDGVRILNLHSCSIDTFRSVQVVGTVMPNLEELCVAYSNLSDMKSVDLESHSFCHLRILDCSSCQISDWDSQIAKNFSKLPKLEQLNLNDNPIPSIPRNSDELSADVYFPALLSLQFAGTAVTKWNDLEGINDSLSTIKSLRVRNTPLTETMGQGEVRALCIARFPSLEFLNGSAIATQERTEAERRYVTLVTRLLAKERDNDDNNEGDSASKNQTASLLADHPQYMLLREKHKDTIALSESSSTNQGGSGQNIASIVSNVTIRSMAAASCSMEPLARRLPGSLKVGRLKALCARAFGLDVDIMSLHFRTEVKLMFQNVNS